MKKLLLFVLSFVCIGLAQAQFGIWGSGIQLDSNGITQFYATNPANPDPNAIGTSNFQGTDLGTFIQNSGSLMVTGAQIKTFKNTNGNVCSGDMFYTVYPTGNRTGISFTDITLGFYDNCSSGTFPTGGACSVGDQKWQTIGQSNDLTTYAPGNYTLEVYYQANGTNDGTCGDATVYDNNNSNPTNYTATFTISVVTPVVLQSFTATPNSNTASLKWTDAQEINVSGFDIERSTDGEIYTTISWQQAKGASTTNSYSYTDNNLPDANQVFYRLKIVDADGSYKYSYIVPVNLSATVLTLTLSDDNLIVNTATLPQGVYTLQLYSVDGKLITDEGITVSGSSSTQSVSLTGINLSKGIYAVVLRNAAGRVVAKNTVMAN